MKNALLAQFARDPVVDLLRPLRPRAATVFTFHRFADAARGNGGHAVAALRANLAFLRRHRLHIVPLSDLIATLEAGEDPAPGTVALTVDDGYGDFASVAAPIFAEFDCPTTVFLVSGFLDGLLWLWWDQIWYMFEQTRRTALALDLEGQRFRAEWSTTSEGHSQGRRLAHKLEQVSDACRRHTLDELSAQLDVAVPAQCPARFAPMTWDDVRLCARSGTTFGAHTVTHPILSRVDATTARFEIHESTKRVTTETTAAVPVFCYPNGSPATFQAREVQVLRECGLRAAVTTTPRHVTRSGYQAAADSRFQLPRFPYRDDLPHFAQVVSGVEWVKSVARSIRTTGRLPR
jgi:peptidoglycan/xylan/chitin deacetylase (PgdA/CDA1 family)